MKLNLRKTRFATDQDQDAPPDMLRYDLAFTCTDYPGIIAFPCICSATGKGGLGGRITHARWESFARPVEEILDKEAVAAFGEFLKNHPDRWTTFRHGLHPDGSRDYSNLTPKTLKAFLDAKDTFDL